jgi:hypothetical protein
MNDMSGRSGHEISAAPRLVQGEDQADFDKLHRDIHDSVLQRDPIEEIFADDTVLEQWEIMRWRRVNSTSHRQVRPHALKKFLRSHIYVGFEETAALLLQRNLLVGEDVDEELAEWYADNPSEAIEAVREIFAGRSPTLGELEAEARGATAWEFAKLYARGEANIVQSVHGLLAEQSLILDDLLIPEYWLKLDFFAAVDRQITISEGRRNRSLHEIERHRATLGAALRRTVERIEHEAAEHEESKMIEATPTEEKDVA